jgi:hypothetical protein
MARAPKPSRAFKQNSTAMMTNGNPLMYSLRYSWVGSYDVVGRECQFCQDIFAASPI